MYNKLSALILGDSWISNFKYYGEKNQELYQTTIESISGGGLTDIGAAVDLEKY